MTSVGNFSDWNAAARIRGHISPKIPIAKDAPMVRIEMHFRTLEGEELSEERLTALVDFGIDEDSVSCPEEGRLCVIIEVEEEDSDAAAEERAEEIMDLLGDMDLVSLDLADTD